VDLALAQDRATLDPRRHNVGLIHRVGELPIGAVPAVRDQVHLRKPRARHIPAVGPQRHQVLQQGPRLRAPIETPPHLALVRLQQPIDLPRADLPQLGFHGRRQGEARPGPRQPQRQQRLQTHRPGIPRRAPQRAQRRHHRRTIPPRPTAATAVRPEGPREPPNQRLAVIARHRHRFVEQGAPRRSPRDRIPITHLLQILLSCCWAHSGSSHLLPPCRWVTRFLAR
jgi:hypothetical protein